MKIWAIVIGRKGRHKRYVAHARSTDKNLAVYGTMAKAKEAKKDILRPSERKVVFIIPFESDCD